MLTPGLSAPSVPVGRSSIEPRSGRLEGRPCMLSSVPLLLEAMGWFEVEPEAWELKESWDSSCCGGGKRWKGVCC